MFFLYIYKWYYNTYIAINLSRGNWRFRQPSSLGSVVLCASLTDVCWIFRSHPVRSSYSLLLAFKTVQPFWLSCESYYCRWRLPLSRYCTDGGSRVRFSRGRQNKLETRTFLLLFRSRKSHEISRKVENIVSRNTRASPRPPNDACRTRYSCARRYFIVSRTRSV